MRKNTSRKPDNANAAGGGEDPREVAPGTLEERVAELEKQVAELEAAATVRSDQIATLTTERDTWQLKATSVYDQYLRAKADMDGYRKRSERDFEDRLDRSKADYLRSVLDVLDNFERFLEAAEKSGQEGRERGFDAFFKGVSMVHRQLMDTLAREGVEPIEDSVGKQMDPAFHEAVVAQDGGEHGVVLAELQKGYVYKGLVLRATKVKVAR